jgi:hypothetical protein
MSPTIQTEEAFSIEFRGNTYQCEPIRRITVFFTE